MGGEGRGAEGQGRAGRTVASGTCVNVLQKWGMFAGSKTRVCQEV